MGEKTNISWSTSSWSPWIGCTEVSPGCTNCYARELDKRHRYGGATHWGAGVPRYRTKQWDQPLKWNKKAAEAGVRRTVFPSLCDPFDNEVPIEWRRDLFDLIRATPNLTWLLLTKRIGNAADMMLQVARDEWPLPLPNVWLGASVVNQEEAGRDIPKLLATPAATHFVSYEPALAAVDFSRFLRERACEQCGGRAAACKVLGHRPAHDRPNWNVGLDWIIVGGESAQGGAKARPFDLAWARQTVAQCKAAGVACFVKQLGSSPGEEREGDGPTGEFRTHQARRQFARTITALRFKDRAGADPAEWPEDLRVQEFPFQPPQWKP